ncbi:MAG: hypothetical protein KDD44_07975 [Bdellovibrionales bacterium]|nr:hypothetical protein [Bdellovibrionales bacterium]
MNHSLFSLSFLALLVLAPPPLAAADAGTLGEITLEKLKNLCLDDFERTHGLRGKVVEVQDVTLLNPERVSLLRNRPVSAHAKRVEGGILGIRAADIEYFAKGDRRERYQALLDAEPYLLIVPSDRKGDSFEALDICLLTPVQRIWADDEDQLRWEQSSDVVDGRSPCLLSAMLVFGGHARPSTPETKKHFAIFQQATGGRVLEGEVILKRERSAKRPSSGEVGNLELARQDEPIEIKLPKGISFKMPRNWVVFSRKERIELNTIVHSVLDLSHSTYADSDLDFAANFINEYGKTLCILNIRHYPKIELSQIDAKNATDRDIQELDKLLRKAILKSMDAFDGKLIEWLGTKRGTINGTTAFISEYRRKSNTRTDSFKVKLIRIFAANDSFTMTVSYQEAASAVLAPVIDTISNSLRYETVG